MNHKLFSAIPCNDIIAFLIFSNQLSLNYLCHNFSFFSNLLTGLLFLLVTQSVSYSYFTFVRCLLSQRHQQHFNPDQFRKVTSYLNDPPPHSTCTWSNLTRQINARRCRIQIRPRPVRTYLNCQIRPRLVGPIWTPKHSDLPGHTPTWAQLRQAELMQTWKPAKTILGRIINECAYVFAQA